MRKRLYLALLLGTTALFPSAAAADPVTGFIAAAYAASAATAYIGGAIGSYALTAAGVSAMSFLGRALISAGLSYVANKLTSKTSDPYTAQLGNYAQAVSYMQRIYGTVRTGGVFGFTGFVDKKRHYSIIVAAHSTVGPLTHYLSDVEVEIDTDGDVTTSPMSGYGNIRPFTGHSGQTADSVLMAAFPEITSGYDFARLSGAHLWAKRVKASKLSTVYPDGDIWTYAPIWKGNDQIYDPRDGSTGWTNNWALCFAHELVNYLGAEVDWAEVAAEADVCDRLVTNADGATQRRWTFSRVFTDDTDADTINSEFIAAADGWLYERPDGKIGFRAGRYIAPTVTLTAEDFTSFSPSTGREIGSNSQYVIKYAEPLNLYKDSVSGTYVFDGTARRVTSETEIYGIDSHNQAARVAKRLARSEHPKFSITAQVKLIGFELIGQRFVRIVHKEIGIDMTFEVTKLALNSDGLSWSLEASSVTEEDFSFVAATEEPERPTYQDVESADDVDDLTGLVAAVLGTSNGSAAITSMWDSQDESYRQQIRLRSPGAGIDDWQIFTAGDGQAEFVATGLVDGAQYEIQGRNETTSGRVGDWQPETPIYVTAVANTTAPGALSGFAATASGSDVSLMWTAPNSATYFGTRIYRLTSSTSVSSPSIANASVIHVEYGIPSASDGYTDPAPGAGYHYYWAEAVNSSGVAGDRSGPIEVIIS